MGARILMDPLSSFIMSSEPHRRRAEVDPCSSTTTILNHPRHTLSSPDSTTPSNAAQDVRKPDRAQSGERGTSAGLILARSLTFPQQPFAPRPSLLDMEDDDELPSAATLAARAMSVPVDDEDDDFKPTKAGPSKAKKAPDSKPVKKPPQVIPTATKAEIKDEDSDDNYIKPAPKKAAAKKAPVKVKEESDLEMMDEKPAPKKPAARKAAAKVIKAEDSGHVRF